MGWLLLPVFKPSNTKPYTHISLIVALRNEEANVKALLQSLLAQTYPSNLLEIVLVDDHSTDGTKEAISDFLKQYTESANMKLISLDQYSGGKKAAIHKGIGESNGELIVTTDADCVAGEKWIFNLAQYYEVHKPQLILGPVQIEHTKSVFSKLQAFEFSSLLATAAGSCNAGFPLLANGANMAYTRNAFEECGGFKQNFQYASGDDMFMMLNIQKQFGSPSIRFLKSKEAIVKTKAIRGGKSFIHQRIRWVSKSRGYTNYPLIYTSFVVYFTNALVLLTAIAAICESGFKYLFIIFFLSKCVIDFTLLFSYNRFQKTTSILWWLPIAEIANATYTFIIGIIGNWLKYEWKGRKTK